MDDRLIFDIGANHGEDSEHYLAQGYRVLAVEANPSLAGELKEKFANQIREGEMVILDVGIGPHPGALDFFINESNDEHSSFDAVAGQRGGRWHTIPILCTTMSALLKEYGVPYFLKVDIELADRVCIEALSPIDLPAYVSIEAHDLSYLCVLWSLGYRKFKVVDQRGHNHPRVFDNETVRGRLAGKLEFYRRQVRNRSGRPQRFKPGSSGPFGEETVGPWVDLETAAYEWLHVKTKHTHRGTLDPSGWFDFHARI